MQAGQPFNFEETKEAILNYVREIERQEGEHHDSGGSLRDTTEMRRLREYLMRELIELRKAQLHMYRMGIFKETPQ